MATELYILNRTTKYVRIPGGRQNPFGRCVLGVWSPSLYAYRNAKTAKSALARARASRPGEDIDLLDRAGLYRALGTRDPNAPVIEPVIDLALAPVLF